MAGNTKSVAIPILYTTGSYYETGFNVGSFYADRIKNFFQKSSRVQEKYVPYIATENGKRFFQATLNVTQENFPQHIRELQGIADGSGLPFEDIFLLNISKEIGNVLVFEENAKKDDGAGCSDIFVNTPQTKLLAHNEDCDPMVALYGYMVSAHIVEDGQEIQHFTAFCYPGTLPGCTFSFNKHGMIFTVDGLYPTYIVHNAPTRMFLNRAVMKASNIEEAITILKNKGFGSAYGFCTNIADLKCPSKMWSIELGPHANESILHVHTIEEEADSEKPCHYFHFNKFKHLKLDEKDGASSKSREKRANQLPAPRTRQEILTILGDTTHDEYPIFRTPRPSDLSETVFTSVVDISQNQIEFYRGNPLEEGAVPLFQLRIKY